MKICSKCKINKSISEFYKNRSRKDGLDHRCKICSKLEAKEYLETKEGIKVHDKYYQSEQYQKAQKRYRQSDRGKQTKKKYRQKNRMKVKAHYVVNYAITTGIIVRPERLKCFCGKKAKDYHHCKGYEPKHWFSIIPVCGSCHYKLHQLVDNLKN